MSEAASESVVVRRPASSRALARLFRSSIGQKAIMALTGMALSVFVLAHMAGNLLAFQGAAALDISCWNHCSR